jgi:hypothetical protein
MRFLRQHIHESHIHGGRFVSTSCESTSINIVIPAKAGIQL